MNMGISFFIWILVVGFISVVGNSTGQPFEAVGIVMVGCFILSFLGIRAVTVIEYEAVVEIRSALASAIAGFILAMLNVAAYKIVTLL